jgi:hypothetical protein
MLMSSHGDEETFPAVAANGENAPHNGPYSDGAALGYNEKAASERPGPNVLAPGTAAVDP